MFTRRDAVVGGALTLIWGGCACAQNSEPGFATGGCMIEPAEVQSYMGSATQPQLFDGLAPEEKIITSSGNREFDFALARTLSKLTDVYGVLPGFCYYDDSAGMNAKATSVTKLQRADGTVLYGQHYLAWGMKHVESPEVVISATCAHEFGHIVQFKHKLMGRLNKGKATVKLSELHADFFAGYFAGARKLEKSDYPAAVFATNRYARGDNDLNSPDHHGTKEERAAAVIRGFETCYRERHTFAEAIQIGLNYVLNL